MSMAATKVIYSMILIIFGFNIRSCYGFLSRGSPVRSTVSFYRMIQSNSMKKIFQLRLESMKASQMNSDLYVENDQESTWETTDSEEFDIDDDSFSRDDNYLQSGEEEIEDDVDEEISYIDSEYRIWLDALRSSITSMERKLQSLELELKKAEDVEKTVARAQLIVSNLYLFKNPSIKTVQIQDWENGGTLVDLSLNPQYDSAQDEADSLFTQARKLKRGSLVIENLKKESENLLEHLRDIESDFKVCKSDQDIDVGLFSVIQSRLRRISSKARFNVPPSQDESSLAQKKENGKRSLSRRSTIESTIRRLKSPGGCSVLVGRNRRGNEYLTFQVAKGNDIWMHARGCPGAHVILQQRRGSPKPTQECLEFCANLAVFYSDSRNERKASVTAADSKHLLKPQGAPLGAVKVREELFVLTGWPENVPEELKLARDESGQSDEFRAQDKAKRRKKTREVAKQNQEKRKEEKVKKQRAKRKQGVQSVMSEETFDPF
jgi:predicted ribosome quality control (RQC) complex YloA/Tae2 family protein